MIQINPLQSYIDGGARAALTTPPSASLVFDLPGRAIWVKGVKLKGIDHTYTFSHDNYITLTNTPDKNNPESEDINIGVNITTLKNAIDTTYNGGTLALLQEGVNTEERTWLAKILHSYINNVLPTTKNLQINGTDYAIYTTEDSLPLFFAPVSLGTIGQILACTSSGLSWINLIQNTDYRVSLSSATNNSDYRIILKQEADNNAETNFVRFSEYLTFNPSTKILKINNIKVVTATDIYVGATSIANATAGLIPAATSEQYTYFLRGDGTWVNIATEMAAANTWRPIKVENTDALGSGTDTGTLSFTAGTGITLAWDATNKRIIITNSSPDVNHNTDETVRQVPKTDDINRPLMMINGSTSAGEQINTSMFSTGIYANASTKMITANGFIKAGSSDDYVLLGGGNHKALSDFSMSHEHPYLPIAYTNDNQTDDWGKNYAKTHYNSYVYNSNGREWSYWIGMHPSLTYGNILRLSHDGLVLYCHKTGGDKDSNWSSWKSIITSDNFNSYSPTLIGTGASGTWNINISGNANTATNSTSSSYARNLLGRTTSGTDYSATNGNLIFAEWNTYSDNRWYLKATGYECRVNYATNAGNADTLDGNHASAFATSGHNHDGRYLYWGGNAANAAAMGWGTLTAANGYTILSHASSSDGGDMGFVNKNGQIFMLLDGYYYQNEGRYRVLDTSDFTAFSNIGSLTTRITIGEVTKDLKIDADTIDGYHESSLYKLISFLPNDGNKNCDDFILDAFYTFKYDINATSNTLNNIPTNVNIDGGCSILNINHGNYNNQIFFDYGGVNLWFRGQSYNSKIKWNSWHQLLHSNNYTLYCATSNHNHDGKYLRKDTNDSTPYQYTFTKTDDHAIRVGTVRGTAVGSLTGEYIHLYERVAIGSPNGWGSRSAPSYGLATYGGTWLATDTGNVTIGGTNQLSSVWGSFNLTVGNNTNKVVIGYLNSSTNGVVVGGHNNALSAWAPLNIAGTTLYFRINETIKAIIDSNGNVGIGTTSPSQKLHIYGGIMRITNNDNYVDIGALNNSWIHFLASQLYYFLNSANNTVFDTHVKPYTSGSKDLGSSSLEWRTGYIHLIYARHLDNSANYTEDHNLYIGYSTTYDTYIYTVNPSRQLIATFNSAGITLGNENKLIRRVGKSVAWIYGRDSAIVRQISPNGYSAVVSSKTASGSWEIGNYTSAGESLYFTYITDSNYSNRNNSVTGQVYFNSGGSIYAAHFYEHSDIRYKKILRNLLINSNTIATLPLFDFEWIENNYIGTGTSAQAVKEILPNIVSGTDKLTLDYGVLGTIAGITACKELVTLKSELQELKEKVKLLEDRLRKYENTL